MSDEYRNGLFEEQKRRNIYRVALAHLNGAWLLIQIADIVFPNIRLPDRSITIVIVFARFSKSSCDFEHCSVATQLSHHTKFNLRVIGAE